jgi:hypothetical protein
VQWRGALRRHLALLLAMKFAALALLWALFFLPAHHTRVDAQAAGKRLALVRPQAAAPPSEAPRRPQARAHD